jgi:tRNA modification GTPase
MENLFTNVYNINDTICAMATPAGVSALCIIRLSGKKAISIGDAVFKPLKKELFLSAEDTHTIHYGLLHSRDAEIVDEVLISVFKDPHSYTGEDMIEISCHGSVYVQQQVLQLLIDNGARLAKPGEFTFRAFLNKKMDLSQAEAVADLIASNSKSSHKLAVQQMRGGFSLQINELRKHLVDFASLIELELDFSEEDVQFASREKLSELLNKIAVEINALISSFSVGNVLKSGIPVTIVGKPNVGKSTLLNAILNEEKAIVSEIPGTTRDIIEDTIIIDGIAFRFIDTAGLRGHSSDKIESIGIGKTYEKIEQAAIILYVFDVSQSSFKEINDDVSEFMDKIGDKNKHLILIANKTDQLVEVPRGFKNMVELETIFVSAKRKENISLILESLVKNIENQTSLSNTIVSNIRHYEALISTKKAVEAVQQAMLNNVSPDLYTIDIKTALHYLGEITGNITTDEVLNNIFSNFCIGK